MRVTQQTSTQSLSNISPKEETSSKDIRTTYPPASIYSALTELQHTYINPTASNQNTTTRASLPYLTVKEAEIVTGVIERKDNTQIENSVLHQLFPSATPSKKYSLTPNSITLQAPYNTSLSVSCTPRYLSYVEYPTECKLSTPVASGSYKDFFLHNHNNTLLPLLRSPSIKASPQKHLPIPQRVLLSKAIPRLTQKILDNYSTPGAELLVLPEITHAPTLENNYSTLMTQSYFAPETLSDRIKQDRFYTNAEQAKSRLRDVLFANKALFEMGIYNFDIKADNAIVTEVDGEERVLLIDIDDLALKHCTTRDEKKEAGLTFIPDVFSHKNDYYTLYSLIKEIPNRKLRGRIFIALFQSTILLRLFHSLLPYKQILYNLFTRLTLDKTFKEDPALLFVTSPYPLTFLQNLQDVYKESSLPEEEKKKEVNRLEKIRAYYMKKMAQGDRTLLESMKCRLSCTTQFTTQDLYFLIDPENNNRFVNIMAPTKKEIPLSDVDPLDIVIMDRNLTDPILNAKTKDYFHNVLPDLLADLRAIYQAGPISNDELRLLATLLFDVQSLLTKIPPNTNVSSFILNTAETIQSTLFTLCNGKDYVRKIIPHRYGVIPILNEEEIQKLEQHLTVNTKASNLPPQEANTQGEHTLEQAIQSLTTEDIYADMPPLEE